ncbi:MAG: hypothetical protein KKG70_13430 [Proteobacteria bacterium]|nr:hypothetical protein [Pseudomonadota bacterium]
MSSLKKIKRGVLKERSNKAIGYFAILRGTPNILCDEDACVIGFKKENLKRYITTLGTRSTDDYIIKKTTFGEIYKGMNLAEFKIEVDDQPPSPEAVRLMKIAWYPARQEE